MTATGPLAPPAAPAPPAQQDRWRLEVTHGVSLAFLIIALFCVWRRVMDIGVYKAFGFEKVDVRQLALSDWDLRALGLALVVGVFAVNILRYYLASWLVELSPPPWEKPSGFMRWAEEMLRYSAVVLLYVLVWIVHPSANDGSLRLTRWLLVVLVGVFLAWDLIALVRVPRGITAAARDWWFRALRWFIEDAVIIGLLVVWNTAVIPWIRESTKPDTLAVGMVLTCTAAPSTVALVTEFLVELVKHRSIQQLVVANWFLRRLLPFGVIGIAAGLWVYRHC